jgi:hypothetical protein
MYDAEDVSIMSTCSSNIYIAVINPSKPTTTAGITEINERRKQKLVLPFISTNHCQTKIKRNTAILNQLRTHAPTYLAKI